jgi:hypothetical protein
VHDSWSRTNGVGEAPMRRDWLGPVTVDT